MAVTKKVSLAVIYDIILINIWRNQFSVDIDIAPGFINTKYECMRPTPDIPKHNRKLLSLLRLIERKRQLDSEDKRSLSYRHAISAIKVRLDQPKTHIYANYVLMVNFIGISTRNSILKRSCKNYRYISGLREGMKIKNKSESIIMLLY